jgi:membrane associated rhomboid family serine protease
MTTTAATHPFELILRRCAEAAPRPWRPSGMPDEDLREDLEHLLLDGLIRKAPAADGDTGVVLTPAGQGVLADPAALRRLTEGKPLVAGDRGGIVRSVLRRRPRPVVTRVLLGLNFAVFAYGGVLAVVYGGWNQLLSFLTMGFFGGGGKLLDVLEATGGLTGKDWAAGEWWRLATCCFNHFGLLHLGLNMYALWTAGRYVEQMWGRVRFVVIYAFAGLGGSCVGLAMQPGSVLVGASGALCGVLAAEAVWVLCNARFLPRSVAGPWRGDLFVNFILVVVMSLIPGVSFWAHIGGAVTGAAVALVLQVQRFGRPPWRWLAPGLLVPLPALGYLLIEHQRAVSWSPPKQENKEPNKPEEKREEEAPVDRFEDFQRKYEDHIREVMNAAIHAFTQAERLLREAPEKRDAAKVAVYKEAFMDRRDRAAALADELAKVGPCTDEKAEHARQAALVYIRARAELLALAARRLREGDPWTNDDDKKLEEVQKLRAAWNESMK